MRLKGLIVDDEPLAINVIEKYAERIDSLEIVQTFDNAIDAINYLHRNDVDFIFPENS